MHCPLPSHLAEVPLFQLQHADHLSHKWAFYAGQEPPMLWVVREDGLQDWNVMVSEMAGATMEFREPTVHHPQKVG
jgi:hypothetical protein